jgi:hypothetical protein
MLNYGAFLLNNLFVDLCTLLLLRGLVEPTAEKFHTAIK